MPNKSIPGLPLTKKNYIIVDLRAGHEQFVIRGKGTLYVLFYCIRESAESCCVQKLPFTYIFWLYGPKHIFFVVCGHP